jgi:hypothetical protein
MESRFDGDYSFCLLASLGMVEALLVLEKEIRSLSRLHDCLSVDLLFAANLLKMQRFLDSKRKV